MAKARQLAKVAAQNGYNTEFAFLVDMSVKSNKNRFFVVNLRTLSIEMTSLVAQGRGKERLNLDKDYSNSPGSNCSSLGMYKIGKSYDGDFGRSYRLFGMDATNKNAYQRAIVLHAMGSIPNIETNFPIWQSEGCPSVSTLMLEKLGSLIDGSKKPVLMWMYDDTYIPMTDKSSNSQPGNSGS
nr:murein L,D-transpeptidase catalytic domain family protein [Flavihumibacter fluvii]